MNGVPEKPVGLLVMAYGTPRNAEDIERYYTDIRGGRAPTPALIADLRRRYEAIGNRFPLLEVTRGQAEGLARALNRAGDRAVTFRAYVGMKHAPPFIGEAVAGMREDGIERAVGIVMAPHWSAMSVENYIDRVQAASTGQTEGPSFTFVRQWYDHPRFVRYLGSRVLQALDRLEPERAGTAAVVFSAHSLPLRTDGRGNTRCLRCDVCQRSCRYVEQLRHTADLVAARASLPSYLTAWQSAGQTPQPWWGPSLEDVIPKLAADGHTAVVVCACGFTADHLETLYDLDVEARTVAEEAGIGFARTEMPNADPSFVDVLAAVVRDHLARSGSRPW